MKIDAAVACGRERLGAQDFAVSVADDAPQAATSMQPAVVGKFDPGATDGVPGLIAERVAAWDRAVAEIRASNGRVPQRA